MANSSEVFFDLVKHATAVQFLHEYQPITIIEGQTDANNAIRLDAKYGDVLRWAGPWDKWLVWDGTRWKIDQFLRIHKFAKNIAGDLFKEISALMREKNQ